MTAILDAELGLSSVADLKAQLVEALRSGDRIDVDVSKVSAADTAAIQLLAAFMNSVRGSEKTVRWHGNSDALLASARLSGFARHLALNTADEKCQ